MDVDVAKLSRAEVARASRLLARAFAEDPIITPVETSLVLLLGCRRKALSRTLPRKRRLPVNSDWCA
jgi:hypothetical protein